MKFRLRDLLAKTLTASLLAAALLLTVSFSVFLAVPATAASKTPTANQVKVVTDGKQLAWNMNATIFFSYYNSELENYAPSFMTIKKFRKDNHSSFTVEPDVQFRVFLSSDKKLLRKVSLRSGAVEGAETKYSPKGINMLLATANVLTRGDSTEDVTTKIVEIEAGRSENFAVSYGNISLNYKIDPDGKHYEISLTPNQEKAAVSEPSTSASTLAQASTPTSSSAAASATASNQASSARSSADPDASAGELATVYVTLEGKSFHRDSCPTISNSAIVNAISREEASKTRSACKVCKP